jgi:hypothetical protein
MTIEELTASHYEDLSGRVISVAANAQAYKIRFECTDWEELSRTRVFDITFNEVVESSVTPEPVEGIQIPDDHPLLWKHNCEHVSIFFSSIPPQPFELLGRLYETHLRIFEDSRPMSDFVHADSKILSSGCGLLAQGPKPLMEEFAAVLAQTPAVRFTIVHAFTPAGNCRLILFDQKFIIFKAPGFRFGTSRPKS